MSVPSTDKKTQKPEQQPVENTKEQGQPGNIKQNTTNQGRQQDR
jgi:hypothetical protein